MRTSRVEPSLITEAARESFTRAASWFIELGPVSLRRQPKDRREDQASFSTTSAPFAARCTASQPSLAAALVS
jgi:hypothetical protein